MMLNNLLKEDEEITTDANASLKGIELQKLRAVQRLLRPLIDGKKAGFCTIEYIDDVDEMDIFYYFDILIYRSNKEYKQSLNAVLNIL